jgi:hypothetical protein
MDASHVELRWWPCARPIAPLDLLRLNSLGEAMLTARLPRRLPTALATAEMLLEWVTNRWHCGASAFAHADANRILDRASAGARYGADEYTIVLTQALNAFRIPARRLRLLAESYHGGHTVSEAWIDDLGKWVVFDGRNGATWRDTAGTPLGAVELQQHYLAEDQPEFHGTGTTFLTAEAKEWFSFFHTVAVTDGLAWSSGPYVPVLPDGTVLRNSRLADSNVDAAPDLSAIGTSVTDGRSVRVGREKPVPGPALLFQTEHPYTTGFTVLEQENETFLEPGQPFPLAGDPGDHRLTVATSTPYGTLTAHHLHYRIS